MEANTKLFFSTLFSVAYLTSPPGTGSAPFAFNEGRPVSAGDEERPLVQKSPPPLQSQDCQKRIQLSPSHRFRKETVLPAGNTWDDQLATLPAGQRTYLEEINSNYFGVLSYGNIEELQRMAALGFPMPEEWIDSRYLTDAELKEMADSGNIKARMFYADRLINKAGEYLPLRNTKPPSFDSSPGFRIASLAYIEVGRLLRSTSSPFAAYIQGRSQFSLSATPSPESVAGAMVAASNRGDARAQNFLRGFKTRHPGMNASFITAVSEMGKPSGFARDQAGVFEFLRLYIGQSIDEAKRKYPAMQCENSCVLEGQEAFGHPGRLWAGMRDGRIHQIAFGFKPVLTAIEAEEVRRAYTDLYGQASDHLGVEGCDEWSASGGYLAICLSPELSHVWWSTESRVDINIQNQRKQK